MNNSISTIRSSKEEDAVPPITRGKGTVSLDGAADTHVSRRSRPTARLTICVRRCAAAATAQRLQREANRSRILKEEERARVGCVCVFGAQARMGWGGAGRDP